MFIDLKTTSIHCKSEIKYEISYTEALEKATLTLLLNMLYGPEKSRPFLDSVNSYDINSTEV